MTKDMTSPRSDVLCEWEEDSRISENVKVLNIVRANENVRGQMDLLQITRLLQMM